MTMKTADRITPMKTQTALPPQLSKESTARSRFKFRRAAALVGLAALLTLCAAPSANADTKWWSNAGAPANEWGQTNNWATTAAGDTPALAAPTAADIAIFNIDSLTTAQTVYMNADQAAAGLQYDLPT